MKGEDVFFREVGKSYGDRAVLTSFTHRFAGGTVTNIMGPSGCGKTTLLHLAAGLLTPDTGIVVRTQPVAVVFQENRLCEQFTLAGNLRFALGRIGRETMLRALSAVGLAECENTPVSQLSGGMRRRVAIVRAMLSPAPIVLLDEAFKGLDAALRDEVCAFVRRSCEGRTVLSVTHDEAEAELLGGAVLRLKNSKNGA